MFYGTYTAMGLINSIIYLGQIGNYPGWVMLLVLVGIGALIYGVKLLSQAKPEPAPARVEEDQEMGDISDHRDRSPKEFTFNESLDDNIGSSSNVVLDTDSQAGSRIEGTSELGLI